LPDTIKMPKEEHLPFEMLPGVKLLNTLSAGKAGPISSNVIWSPDGRTLTCGSEDNTIRLWDSKSGKLLRTLEGHTGTVNSVVWSPDGSMLASGSDDYTIRLWNLKSGKLLKTLKGHTYWVQSVAWSPDSLMLASGSDDKTIRLWDLKTRKLLRTLEGHTDDVSSVAWSPDGLMLASGSGDKTIRLWDPKNGQLLRTLEGNTRVDSVAWSPDGLMLASLDNIIRLWDPKSGELLRTLKRHTTIVYSVLGWSPIVNSMAWSPDGMTLASCSTDRTIRLWDPKSGKLLQIIKEHSSVKSVAWSPDGLMLASSSDGINDDTPIRLWDLKSGKLLRILEGHTSYVKSVAWSPDGMTLASSSFGTLIRLWDPKTGQLLRALEGHRYLNGLSLAWSPDGMTLASDSSNNTIKLWNPKTRKLLRTLKGHTSFILSLAWSPDGMMLVSGSDDKTIRLWDPKSGKLLRMLEGHTGYVKSVAWSPNGLMLASGSGDKTIRLWDPKSGKLLRMLEGDVNSLTWSPDGLILASGSNDKTIRLWDPKKGRKIRILEGHTSYISTLSFSYDGKLLISSSGNEECIWDSKTWTLIIRNKHQRSKNSSCSIFHPKKSVLAILNKNCFGIDILELDLSLLGEHKTVQSVNYKTAKILLVGDSGVGKTGLGWRLAHGEFKEHASTHGQQFWTLDQLHLTDGAECEAVLWDLAGQPDYRLIHALFFDDAELALVLFDPTVREDPLHGVDYWLKALCFPKEHLCKSILIGARTDRGDATLSEAEINHFCRDRKITGGYLGTSALKGDGLNELLERIKQLIVWDEITAITTTDTFKRIKEYVLSLKETGDREKLLVTPVELRTKLKAMDEQWVFDDVEMMTAVRHLARQGYVQTLRTIAGTETILLKPELLNNLAASFVLEARRNPKGLGALEEERVVNGGFQFPELQLLTPEEQAILLDATMVLFIEHNVCFRETLGNTKYLIFPALINQKKPHLKNEIQTEDDISYTVTGTVENLYAALVVLLCYTSVFRRTNQWQNQAQYEVSDGEICGFRQMSDQDGTIDLILYYGVNVIQSTRLLFQGLVERFLINHMVTITKYPSLKCDKCNYHQLRNVVVQLTREKKEFLFCSVCGEKIYLPKVEDIDHYPSEDIKTINKQQAIANYRTKFEEVLIWIQNYIRSQNTKSSPIKCFISYAWGEPKHEKWVEWQLARDLQKAGFEVILDRWLNSEIGSNIVRFIEMIPKCETVIVIGTPLYLQKYENKLSKTGSVVAAEVDLINNRMLGTEDQKKTIRPVLLTGDPKDSLPPLMQGRIYADFRNERDYFTTLFDLILSIYQIPFSSEAVIDLRETLKPLKPLKKHSAAIPGVVIEI
jgi:small GTP-binding protein